MTATAHDPRDDPSTWTAHDPLLTQAEAEWYAEMWRRQNAEDRTGRDDKTRPDFRNVPSRN